MIETSPPFDFVHNACGRLIVGGMWLQALASLLVLSGSGFTLWACAMLLLGLGTALVYPTLLAAVSDVAHPDWRASAVGALLAGVLADVAGVSFAVAAIAVLTFASGLVVFVRMYETLPTRRQPAPKSTFVQMPSEGALR
jgi:MFS family permease